VFLFSKDNDQAVCHFNLEDRYLSYVKRNKKLGRFTSFLEAMYQVKVKKNFERFDLRQYK
jgi:hypothetical protein